MAKCWSRGGTNTSELYNPATGVWTATGLMAVAQFDGTATLLPNGQVLVAGGISYIGPTNTNAAELYNPANGTWTATGSMNSIHYSQTATLLPNGKLLVAGGDCCGSAELYNPTNGTPYGPTNGTWTAAGSLNPGRTVHTETLLPTGDALVAGGYSGGAFVSNAELYVWASGTWTNTGTMN